MTLQIELEGVKRVIFTGSLNLMNTITQIDESKFPFQTQIKKINRTFQFT